MTASRRLLVVAIQTLAGPSAGEQLHQLAGEQPTDFHFLVPVTKPEYGMTWTWAQARRDAEQRLNLLMEFATAAGLQVTGEVAAADPREAVRATIDASEQPFDGMVVLFRRKWRKWLRGADRTRIEEATGMPVVELEADPPMRNSKIADPDELRELFRETAAEKGWSTP